MAHVLTWKVLDQERSKQCLMTADINAVRELLLCVKADDPNGAFPYSGKHNEGQARILLDLYAHAILFAKSLDMSSAKMSSLVGILHTLHETSMSERFTRPASYDLLRDLFVRHSVARPPYSAAIFSLDDVRDADEYLLSTYYRHYKMYYFAFVPKQTAVLRMVPLGAVNEVPPADLPPLAAALTAAEWKQNVEGAEQAAEAARMEEELRESEELDRQHQQSSGLNDPVYTEGIREQLTAIRSAVMQKSTTRLDTIEEKLTAIEAKVDEVCSRNRPASKTARKK